MDDRGNNIGYTIKLFREMKHMSQTQLAELLGVSQRNVSYYESGDRIPPADILKKIASTFEISIDELLGVKKVNSTGDCYDFSYEDGLANWNIKEKAKSLGLSYENVLDKTDIPQERFDLLWFGNSQPCAEELLRFSEVLNVSIDYLLDNSQREHLSTDEALVLEYYNMYPTEVIDLLGSFCNLRKRDRTILLGKCFELEQTDSSVAAEKYPQDTSERRKVK